MCHVKCAELFHLIRSITHCSHVSHYQYKDLIELQPAISARRQLLQSQVLSVGRRRHLERRQRIVDHLPEVSDQGVARQLLQALARLVGVPDPELDLLEALVERPPLDGLHEADADHALGEGELKP